MVDRIHNSGSTAMPIGGPDGNNLQHFPAAQRVMQTAYQVYDTLPGGPSEQDARDFSTVVQAIKSAPKKVDQVAKADGDSTAAAGLVQTAVIAQSSGSESGAQTGKDGGDPQPTPQQRSEQAAKEAKERAANAAAAGNAAAAQAALDAQFAQAMQASSEAQLRALESKGWVSKISEDAVLQGFKSLDKDKTKEQEQDYIEKIVSKRDFLRAFYNTCKGHGSHH